MFFIFLFFAFIEYHGCGDSRESFHPIHGAGGNWYFGFGRIRGVSQSCLHDLYVSFYASIFIEILFVQYLLEMLLSMLEFLLFHESAEVKKDVFIDGRI